MIYSRSLHNTLKIIIPIIQTIIKIAPQMTDFLLAIRYKKILNLIKFQIKNKEFSKPIRTSKWNFKIRTKAKIIMVLIKIYLSIQINNKKTMQTMLTKILKM